MVPLENRIAQLTPEQQQEVSDFVDFLLLKNTIREGTANPAPAPAWANFPPVMVSDHTFNQPADPSPETDSWSHSVLPPFTPHGKPAPPAIHEITGGGDDIITREYLDYGSFAGAPPAATDMQKKGRHRIIARDEKEKTPHILEWVD